MRKISASYIFPITRPPVKNGVLLLTADGTIIDLLDPERNQPEEKNIEHYEGIISPGFVNAHCHLELSYLKNKIAASLGLGGFIGEINKLRNNFTEKYEDAIIRADQELYLNGISATGDISNTLLSLNTKLNSPVYYHTFVESFGFLPSRAERAFEIGTRIFDEFKLFELPASIVPHSPYSVSDPLFRKIIDHAKQYNSIISLHNQESQGENQFFRNGTGPIANHLGQNIGLDISGWIPTGKNSTESVLKYIPVDNQLILVHNTFTTATDIDFLKENRSMANTFFCLCPNSNLFIENRLPDIRLFRFSGLNICLGTDSLASNSGLSVLSEIAAIQSRFPEIPFTELLRWATINGAMAIGASNRFGTFEPGKKPGVNLISGIDHNDLLITSECRVKRLA